MSASASVVSARTFDARGVRLVTVPSERGMTGDSGPHGVSVTRSSDRTLLQSLGFNDPDKGNEEHDLGCRYLIQPEPMAKLVDLVYPRDKLKSPWHDYMSKGYLHSPDPHPEDKSVKHSDLRVASVHHEGSLESVVQRSAYGGGGYHIGFLDALIAPVWMMSATQRIWRRPNDEEIEKQVGKRPVEPAYGKGDRPDGDKLHVSRYCRHCGGSRGTVVPDERSHVYGHHIECEAKATAFKEAANAWRSRAKEALNQWVESETRTVTAEAGARLSRHDDAGTGSVGIEVKIGRVPIGTAIRQIKLYASYCVHVSRWVLATRCAISKDDSAALKNEGILHIRLAGGFDAYLEQQRQAPEAQSFEM